jgi:hypothetical protein
MPDQTRLDDRLARGRAELLDTIDQPPLAAIGARASARRHRRHSIRTGVALAAVVGVALAVVRPWAGGAEPRPNVADAVPPGAIYTDAGITINGLDSLGDVHQLPGAITDVEFPDPDRGYAIGCTNDECAIGRTTDGGLTWQSNALPAEMGASVDLLPFPGETLVVAAGGRDAWISSDDGHRWERTAAGTGARSAADGELLRLGSSGGIEVWSAEAGYRGHLSTRPSIDVRWVASGPAADGAWWVAGVEPVTGRPAIAVSTDGGVSWTPEVLPVTGTRVDSVQVSVFGSHAYTLVLGGEGPWARPIVAIFHSADGGETFTPTRQPGAPGGPESVAGELIPLLDGRLLIAGGDHRWYVSADDGATFTMTGESLPAVSRLGMTPGGYVAYNLFGTDWAAYSSDGSTWRKLRAH